MLNHGNENPYNSLIYKPSQIFIDINLDYDIIGILCLKEGERVISGDQPQNYPLR